MFDGLTNKLQDVFKKIRGQAYLTETNITDTMRQIRLALLDADVNLEVAKEFVDVVGKECLGHKVLRSVTPGQQVIKVVHDHLVKLMGSTETGLKLDSFPAVIMVVGLHGGGKTTSCAKLAANLKKQGKKVLLTAGDIYRPAAIDQLETLGAQIDVPVYLDRGNPSVDAIARAAKERARSEGLDVVIIDTAGRLQIDEEMVRELVRVSQAVMPKEILLVADAALGQEAVSVSQHFHKALGLTGVMLTKLDGDARGGAALSILKATGCPIKYVGVGEKIEDFEIFYPDRMASRILGMGDIVSLVERAADQIDAEEAEKIEAKLKANKFDLNDFLQQLRQMKKMGGVENIIKLLPGGQQALSASQVDNTQFVRLEAMICSMTAAEREDPDLINISRRKRIATGSGTTLEQVNDLLRQFTMMKKMMSKSSLVNSILAGAGLPTRNSLKRGPNFTKKKERKKKRR